MGSLVARLAEVPSNYLLKKFAPSTWIAFLMFSWGAITVGIAGVQSFATVTVTRFLLGLFEAGEYSLVLVQGFFRILTVLRIVSWYHLSSE